MKKIVFYLIVLLLSGSNIWGEEINVRSSVPIKKGWTHLGEAVCVAGGRLYQIQENVMNNKNLAVYDVATMTRLVQRQFIWGSDQQPNMLTNNFGLVDLIAVDDVPYVIVQGLEKNSQERVALIQKLDKDGNFDGEMQIIEALPYESKSNSGALGVVVSKDKKTFAIVSLKPGKKKENIVVKSKLYDSKLKASANAEVELPYSHKEFSFNSFVLSNDGRLFVVGQEQKEIEEDKKLIKSEKFVLIAIDPKGKVRSDYKLIPDGKTIEKVYLTFNKKENELFCMGYYSDKEKRKKDYPCTGFFVNRIRTSNLELLSSDVRDIDKSIVANVLQIPEKRVNREGLPYNMRFIDLVTNADGSNWAVTEQSVVLIVTTQYSTRILSYYDELVLPKISADGKIEKFVMIPKCQHTKNDYGIYSSVLVESGKDKVCIIYNDDARNTSVNAPTMEDTKVMKKGYKSSLFMLELALDGTYTKHIIHNNASAKTLLMIKSDLKQNDQLHYMPSRALGSGAKGIGRNTPVGISEVSIK